MSQGRFAQLARTRRTGDDELMAPPDKLQRFSLPLLLGDVRVEIAGMYRDGTGIPLVFLHGFGSTKEDYADVIQQADLAERPVLAYDAPGCGDSSCSDPEAASIPFLVSVAEAVLRARRRSAEPLLSRILNPDEAVSASSRGLEITLGA
jgi:pimeloyl-ACP methyl ester carboxylesterase